MIYHYLNLNDPLSDNWLGWNTLWRIPVASHVKHFLWLLLYGRVSTTDYLNSINLAPTITYILCNINLESLEHLFFQCSKSQVVWNLLRAYSGLNFFVLDNICSRAWISAYNFSMYSIALIANTIWILWKARYDAIFKNVSLNYTIIMNIVVSHVKEYMQGGARLDGKHLIMSNYNQAEGPYLF